MVEFDPYEWNLHEDDHSSGMQDFEDEMHDEVEHEVEAAIDDIVEEELEGGASESEARRAAKDEGIAAGEDAAE